jgi:Ca2+-binding RTX toxin-like protein
VLGSAHNDFLGGDKKANALNGGNGNDVLYGSFGADRLTGGAGFDSFNFGWAKEGGDVITDFQAGIDEIGIYRTGFGINGTLEASDPDFAAHYFVSRAGVPSAVNPTGVAPTEFGHGQFLFNQTNDTLWWDSDGAGKAKAVLLASFATNVNLTATDFDLY